MKPILHFDVTSQDDVKADTNQTALPCDAREKNALFAHDEIINLAARRFARNNPGEGSSRNASDLK